jgi:hypothetical protein
VAIVAVKAIGKSSGKPTRHGVDFFQALSNLGLHVNYSFCHPMFNVDRAYAKRGFIDTWAAQGMLI